MSTFFHFHRGFRPKNNIQATPDKKPHKAFRRDIQALRAFAVVAVVLYHLWPDRLIGGFTGVDIFFVISGYLMTTSIMGRLNPLAQSRTVNVKNTLHLLTEFYARRIRRLVPAALTALVGTLALAALSGNLNVLLTNAKNAVSAATFWQNWFLANDSLNYLQQDNLVVATQHFWSLSLEEQFYAMWPLLLVVSTLITINIVVLFKKQKISGAILPITLATLLSLAYGVWLTKHSPTVAYYDTFGRVWELMIGGVIAFLPIIKSYDLKLLMPYAGLTLNLYSIFFISGDGFPGWSALLPTVGTAMIIWAGVGRAESRLAFDNLFSWRPIQWTGDISYSIYLWHFPLIILLPILLHHDINGPHGRLFKIGIVVVSFVVAWLSYIYIERSTQKLRLKTRYVYILFAIATSLVVSLSLGLQHHTENQIKINLEAMHAAVLDESNNCIGGRAILYQKECGDPYGESSSKFMDVGTEDIPSTIGFEEPEICNSFSPYGTGLVKKSDITCVLGDTKSTRTFTVIGDSHAHQYLSTFDSIGRRFHFKVHFFTSIYCNAPAYDTSNAKCADRLKFIQSSKILKDSKFVLLSFLYTSYESTATGIDNFKKATDKPVLLIEDEPRSTANKLSECYTLRQHCTLNEKEATKYTLGIINKLINNHKIGGSDIIYTSDFFCQKQSCYSAIGQLPVYYNTTQYLGSDNSHLSTSFAYTLAPLFAKKLVDAGYLK